MTQMIDDIASEIRAERMILQPLCRATQDQLKPASLFVTDFLMLDVDDTAENFIAKPVCLKRTTTNSPPCLICCRLADHWSHNKNAYSQAHDYREPPRLQVNGQDYYLTNFSASSGAISWIKRVPEREVLEENRKYRLAGTDFTALVIQHAWPEEKIIFTEDARLLYRFLLTRFYKQTTVAEHMARFKIEGIVPPMPKDFIDHPNLPLAPYQKCAVAMSVGNECFGALMQQGTGKTAVTIARIMTEARMKREGRLAGAKQGMYRALIICPQQVRINWENEFQRFATSPGKVSVLRGGILRRSRGLLDIARDEPDCVWGAAVISMDSVRSTWDFIRRFPWDLVVVDESHGFKNPQSKRWKVLKKLSESPNVRSRTILTGTPIANRLFDIWTQLEFLAPGMSGFKSFKNFRSFYGVFEKTDQVRNGSQVEKLAGYQNVPLLQERLARTCFMITKKEAGLQLPEKVYNTYEVQMTKTQSEWYRQLSAQLVLEIEADLRDLESGKKTVTVSHILTKLLRLAQVTSGHITWDAVVDPDTMELTSPKRVEQIPEGNPKVKAIVDCIKEELADDPNGKKIVWACFIEDIRVLSEALHEAGIKHVGYHPVIERAEYRAKDAQAAEERINKDVDCKVFIGNPASGGSGLNILGYDRERPDEYDTYVDHEFFMSQNWSAVQRSQAEDRAHRRGTRCNVQISDVVVPGTIDEKIRIVVLDKQKMALEIQDLRNILKGIVTNEDITEDNGDEESDE